MPRHFFNAYMQNRKINSYRIRLVKKEIPVDPAKDIKEENLIDTTIRIFAFWRKEN